MSPEQYHLLPDLGSSHIRCIVGEGPRVYQGRFIHKPATVVVKPTAAMETGTAAQAIVSGVGRVKQIPREMLTADGKRAGNAWKQYAAENAGCTLLNEKEWANVQNIAKAVMAHPLAGKIYRARGEAEHVIQWHDTLSGLKCKAMLDWRCWLPTGRFIADLKVSSGRDKRTWTKLASDARYHLQEVHYSEGEFIHYGERSHFLFVVVESEPPYTVHVYQMSHVDRIAGREQHRQALDEIAERMQSGDWTDPGENEVQEIELHPYAREMKHVNGDDNDNAGLGGECASGEPAAA